jgi:hypothetical protein
MSKKTVKLTLEVPKGAIDFLTDLLKLSGTKQTPKEFLEEETVNIVKGILVDLPSTWFDEHKVLEWYELDKE